jgi:predicted outer membrane repeat protein
VINNNSGTYGGGLYSRKVSLNLVNCVISGNTISGGDQWTGGAGIYNGTNTKVTITNSTIFSNHNYATARGGGIETRFGSSDLAVLNSILWGNANTSGNNQINGHLGSVSVQYSDIHSEDWSSEPGNIDANPLFVDPLNGDYHLQSNSTCINIGTGNGAPSLDLDGNIRPYGGYDMGAYEYVVTGIISGYIIELDDSGFYSSPISSATVNLREYSPQGKSISNATSDSNGYYEFNSLSNGTYILEVEGYSIDNRQAGKADDSKPWSKEEFINIYPAN